MGINRPNWAVLQSQLFNYNYTQSELYLICLRVSFCGVGTEWKVLSRLTSHLPEQSLARDHHYNHYSNAAGNEPPRRLKFHNHDDFTALSHLRHY